MELGIVSQILSLAREPSNRAAIVKDQGCLPGLVLFLDNPNATVVETAVEALVQLAECSENRTIMYQELGLVLSLSNIIANYALPETTRANARRVLETVTPKPPTTSASDWSVTRENLTKSRTVTLQLRGLDDLYCRKQVEEMLLTVKGIVSFTFDMRQQRVDIRARQEVSVETMCNVISSTKTITAAQVVRTDDGSEVILSFGKGPNGAVDKENCDGGAAGVRKQLKYLDEDEHVSNNEIDPARTIIRAGDAGKSAGWFSSIGSYISKSLYW